jgi:hypothetical protein
MQKKSHMTPTTASKTPRASLLSLSMPSMLSGGGGSNKDEIELPPPPLKSPQNGCIIAIADDFVPSYEYAVTAPVI